jgi:hypothetical protein
MMASKLSNPRLLEAMRRIVPGMDEEATMKDVITKSDFWQFGLLVLGFDALCCHQHANNNTVLP